MKNNQLQAEQPKRRPGLYRPTVEESEDLADWLKRHPVTAAPADKEQ